MSDDDQHTHRSSTSGPHLALAVFCESVLEERSGVLSLIRVIDRVVVEAAGDAPRSMPKTPWRGALIVGFKADAARGRSELSIRPEKPSGIKMQELSFPLFFEGQDRGSNVLVNLVFEFDEEGLYWFDVFLDSALMTRMPLRVLYQPMSGSTHAHD